MGLSEKGAQNGYANRETDDYITIGFVVGINIFSGKPRSTSKME